MHELQATKRRADLPAVGKAPPALEPNVFRDTVVRDEHGDTVLVVASLDPSGRQRIRQALVDYEPPRGATVLRAGGVRNRATTFGYLGRSAAMRRYGCRACDGARKSPDAHAQLAGLAPALARLTAGIDPAQAARDADAGAAIDPGWRLGDSPWSSGVVNWNSAMPYHYDRNNLPAWSVMVVARQGMRGGHLHVPGYDLVVACHDGDAIWFAGWGLLHGVTPLEPVTSEARRLTAVFYSLRGLVACEPPEQELVRARRQRTTAEDQWKERQQAQGLVRLSTPSRATEVQVAVPSHARAEGANVKTLRLLADRGVPPENVSVFVAPGEVEEYEAKLDSELYGRIVVGELGLTRQRNFIARWYPKGTLLVEADDDVTDVRRRLDEKGTVPIEDLASWFEEAFATCKAEGATLWGIYPVLNPMFMKDRVATGLRYCIGHLWGCVNTTANHAMLSEGSSPKEDYERSLQWYEATGNVVRFDSVAAKTRLYAPGGIQAADQESRAEANERTVEDLLCRYPDWVAIQKRRSRTGDREIRLRPLPPRQVVV